MKRTFMLGLCIALALSSSIVEGRNGNRKRGPSPSRKTSGSKEPTSSKTQFEFPYVCTITFSATNRFICGGILVDAGYVATAAHCVDSIDLSKKNKQLTVHCNDGSYTANVTEIVSHENWFSMERLRYDLALLKLNIPSMLPIANITSEDYSLENGTFVSVQLKKQRGGVYKSDGGREVDLVENLECNGSSLWTRSISDSELCLKSTGRKDCSSVAGSILMFKPTATTNNSDPYFFIGVSAFGTKECQRHGLPVVYTFISKYNRWIQERLFEEKIIVPKEKQELLDEQFDRNITDIYKDHSDAFVLAGALHAIDRDDARTLRVFFKLDVDPDAASDDEGRTLLHYAADHDAYRSVMTLLDQGANPSAVSDSGTTAVHAAAASGSVSVANALLEAGADVNAVDNNYSTPLHHLLADERGALVQLLNLLDAGADVQAEDSFDIRPLHRAAQANWISATRILLKAGANLVEYAFDAGAPIHWAAAAGSVDVLQLLIDAGTNIEARSPAGLRETPLSYAVRNDGPVSTVKVLVESGAFLDVKDMDGYSPLHRAASRGALDIIAVLVRAGANVITKNQDGDYPADIFCGEYDCTARKYRGTFKLLNYE